MKQEIDYLYEPVLIEKSKPDFLEVEVSFTKKYISLLERLHDKEKLSMYEHLSLLRLLTWFKKMDQNRKERLINYVVPLMSYED